MRKLVLSAASVLALTQVLAMTAQAGTVYDFSYGYYPVARSYGGWDWTSTLYRPVVSWGYRLSDVQAFASVPGAGSDYERQVGYNVSADAARTFAGSSAYAYASAQTWTWLWPSWYGGSQTYYRTYTVTTGPGAYAWASARPATYWRFSYRIPWTYWSSWYGAYGNYVPFYLNYWYWGSAFDPPNLDFNIEDANAGGPILDQRLDLTSTGPDPSANEDPLQLAFMLDAGTVVHDGDDAVFEVGADVFVPTNVPEPNAGYMLVIGGAAIAILKSRRG
jgi:hypothetical protein